MATIPHARRFDRSGPDDRLGGVAAGLEPVQVATYEHPQRFSPPIQPPIVKRPDPKLLPAENLIATAVVISVPEEGLAPTWVDEDEEKEKAKKAAKKKTTRKAGKKKAGKKKAARKAGAKKSARRAAKPRIPAAAPIAAKPMAKPVEAKPMDSNGSGGM